MSATQKLLDTARQTCSLTSDAALARKFGLTPAAVSNYRQGIRHPEPETIDALAQAIGQPPIEWALRIQAEREQNINPDRAKVWLRWSKQLAGATASLALIYAFSRLDVHTAGHASFAMLYIMRNAAPLIILAVATSAAVNHKRTRRCVDSGAKRIGVWTATPC
jgi:transcriptional regulator with XRE-family HTH domain